jgi:hypothetical protein
MGGASMAMLKRFLASGLGLMVFAGIFLFRDPVTVHFGVGALLIVVSGLGLNWVNRKS